jgi:hypothetical protein
VTPILGIDHPLVAVRDLSAAIETYRNLGFFIAEPGQHPWGTSTALALFHRQILEIVSIGDPSLLDGYTTNNFRFGRHVEKYLDKSEGVALSALYTENAEQVEAELAARKIECNGTINFGRDVIRADGKPDRTKTTLKIFCNNEMPRLSVFACQQHRRDLLEFPDRMVHPNSAFGFDAVTIVSEEDQKADVIRWLTAVHSSPVCKNEHGYEMVQTTNGVWQILTKAQLLSQYGAEISADFLRDGPRIAALDVRVKDLGLLEEEAFRYKNHLHMIGGDLVANDMEKLGGIAMRFIKK